VCSLPPCGGGVGRGVMRRDNDGATCEGIARPPPHPQPLPTRGRGAHRAQGANVFQVSDDALPAILGGWRRAAHALKGQSALLGVTGRAGARGCVARQRSPAAAYWRVRSAVLIRSLTGCGSCPAASLNGGLSRRSTTAKRVTSPLRYEFRNSGLVLNDKHPFHCPFAPTMQEGARMPSRPYILLPSTGLRRMARTR